MSSSQAAQQSHDAPAAGNPLAVSQDARISEFLSFQEEMDRCDAEEATALTHAVPADPPVPVEESDAAPGTSASVAADPVANTTTEPSSSSVAPILAEVGTAATPIEVETIAAPIVIESTVASKALPPAKRVIVLGLPALSATVAAPAKGRKRPCANPDAPKRKRCSKASEAGPSSSKAPSSDRMLQHRAKFASLIDGMIGECESEVERMARELAESQERCAQLEGRLKVIEDVHSVEVSQFEARISDLERDLGKTASSLLKAKDARKAMSSELRKLRRRMKSVDGSTVREAKEGVPAEDRDLETASATECTIQPDVEESKAQGVAEGDDGAVACDGDAMDEDETPCVEGI